jgi:conjugal transfer pilus assembly protein TraF
MDSRSFALLLLAAALAWPAHAETRKQDKQEPAVAGSAFYADKERGWFWYEEPPAEPEPTEEKPEPEAPVVAAEAAAAEPSELPPTGSVAWLKIMLPKLKEAAIDNPSETNIKAFFYAQRLMMDKAERFSRASIETIKNEPLLDEDLRYPASNAASDALADASTKQKDALLKLIAGDAALMLFFNGNDCVLCGQAVAALTGLENKYGFTVIPVSMDGASLPGGRYPNTQYDQGLAEHLGIITTPAIALIVPPNDVRIVSYSTVSMETAANRILASARDIGLITEQEYSATSRMAQIGLISPEQIQDAPVDPTQDPDEFVTRMREAAARAFEIQTTGVKP